MSFIRVRVSHQELAADLVAVLSSRSASQCSAAGRIVVVVCLQLHQQLSSCCHQSQQAASLDYCYTHSHTHTQWYKVLEGDTVLVRDMNQAVSHFKQIAFGGMPCRSDNVFHS